MQRRIAGGLLAACVLCGIAWTQEPAKPGGTKAAKPTTEEKQTGRLPNNFGKVGLTDAQKQKIYGLQAKYSDQIDALVKQVEDLRQKRDTEIEGVLTADQKAKLKGLLEEAAKKKSSKAKADEAK
jgi:Spy/CpxP family protein refolding chaperone